MSEETERLSSMEVLDQGSRVEMERTNVEGYLT